MTSAKEATPGPGRPPLPEDWIPRFVDVTLDSLPGIFFLIDRHQRFRYWNRTLEGVTGFSAQELTGMSALDLFDPMLRESVASAMKRVFETGRASLEAPILVHGGSSRPYSYYGRLIDLEGESYIAGMGLDVSRLKEAQEAEAARSQQLRHLAAHVPGVIYQLRRDIDTGRLSMPYASAKIFDVFGVHHEDVRDDASGLFTRIHADDRERIMRAVDVSARELSPFREQFRVCSPDGSSENAEWVEVESTPERIAEEATLWHGFARLVTERRRMEDDLMRLAYRDTLTDMPNRTMLQIELERRLADVAVVDRGLAVMHLDLDNFKDINDVWGHTTGDRLLRRLAERLQAVVKDRGIIGRVGGDDFLILVDGPDPAVQSEGLAFDLCSGLAAPLDLDRRIVRVTGSIGISLFPEDGETGEDLLRHADAALYRAKANGPGTWARYSPDLTAAAMARRYLETELRSAIEADQLKVALQPVVALDGQQTVGYEALARWHHADDGWIDPEDFIALAESRGLVTPLGLQIYRKAMQHLAPIDGMKLSINVAPAQLHAPDFCDQLVELAGECNMPTSRLEVEITERVLMEESRGALDQIHRLREAGISIAIDDFGTGYSSLAYLRTLPIQRLKIDQGFVRNVSEAHKNAAIVKAILTLARELGFATTAEGVQSVAEADFLREAGCDFAQGWLYGRGQII